MTLSLPTIVPSGYTGDYTDFLRVKADRSGAKRIITGSVSIPSGTTTTTQIGLFPFRAGMKLGYGSFFNVAALGTSVTISLGWQFYDSTQPGTTNTAGYVNASTTAAAGGNISPSVLAGMTFDAVADGWIVAVIGGATTTSTGLLTFNCDFAYDPSGITN